MIRLHRVNAMANWLDTVPPDPPFHQRPEFRFFVDLTREEMSAVGAELERRAAAAFREADLLEAEAAQRREARSKRPVNESLLDRAARLLGPRHFVPDHEPPRAA